MESLKSDTCCFRSNPSTEAITLFQFHVLSLNKKVTIDWVGVHEVEFFKDVSISRILIMFSQLKPANTWRFFSERV